MSLPELPRVLIRCEGGPATGMGHVMRTLALAETLRAGAVPVRYVLRDRTFSGAILDKLGIASSAIPSRLSALDEALWLHGQFPTARWVIVDGYGFDAPYHRSWADTPMKVLAIGDGSDHTSARVAAATLVVNGNVYAKGGITTDGASPTVLAGPRYACVRAEFRAARRQVAAPRQPGPLRLLLTFGGSDVADMGRRTLQCLDENRSLLPALQITLVQGPAALAHPRDQLAESAIQPVTIVPGTQRMADLMQSSDVAIAAAGVTASELAAVGLPAMLITVADNQQGIAAELARAGAAIDLGGASAWNAARLVAALQELGDPERRAHMRRCAMALIDAEGSRRIVEQMERLHSLGWQTAPLRLRPVGADETDARLVWDWRNHPTSRAMSFDKTPISWESHRDWWAHLVTDPQRQAFIAEVNEAAVGTLRFDHLDTASTVVNIAVAPEARGQGHARSMLAQGTRWLAHCRPHVVRMEAHIRLENETSIRAFESAGYRSVSSDTNGAARGVWARDVARESR